MHAPLPEHAVSATLGQVLFGSKQMRLRHVPNRQSLSPTHDEPTEPDATPFDSAEAVTLKHFVFAFPTIPLNPVRHLPHTFGVLEQLSRFRLLQYEGDAAVQFTAFTVVAILFTACTAPSTLPEENELARLVERKLSTFV